MNRTQAIALLDTATARYAEGTEDEQARREAYAEAMADLLKAMPKMTPEQLRAWAEHGGVYGEDPQAMRLRRAPMTDDQRGRDLVPGSVRCDVWRDDMSYPLLMNIWVPNRVYRAYGSDVYGAQAIPAASADCAWCTSTLCAIHESVTG